MDTKLIIYQFREDPATLFVGLANLVAIYEIIISTIYLNTL